MAESVDIHLAGLTYRATADWRDDAACAGMAPLFDPPSGTKSHPNYPEAIAVCHTCPVTAECLADVQPGRDEGVRGGQVLPPITPYAAEPGRCGTRGGARRHRRLDEPVCDPCREAERKLAAADYDHTRRTRGKPR